MRVKKFGVIVRVGFEVIGLIKDGKNVKGVELKSGEKIFCDLVVVSGILIVLKWYFS